MKKFQNFINWIFPKKCLLCSNEISMEGIFCVDCFSKITFIDEPLCKVCGQMLLQGSGQDFICKTCSENQRFFDMARSLLVYDKFSKNILMKLKNNADINVSASLSNLIVLKYGSMIKEFDYIVPVPSHWKRLIKRGFNPPSLLAYEISKFSKISMKNLIKRSKKTQYQKKKNFEERTKNVEGAFEICEEKLIKNKNIILVDDVMTTGSTLNECSKILKEGGATKVICITLASVKAQDF